MYSTVYLLCTGNSSRPTTAAGRQETKVFTFIGINGKVLCFTVSVSAGCVLLYLGGFWSSLCLCNVFHCLPPLPVLREILFPDPTEALQQQSVRMLPATSSLLIHSFRSISLLRIECKPLTYFTSLDLFKRLIYLFIYYSYSVCTNITSQCVLTVIDYVKYIPWMEQVIWCFVWSNKLQN